MTMLRSDAVAEAADRSIIRDGTRSDTTDRSNRLRRLLCVIFVCAGGRVEFRLGGAWKSGRGVPDPWRRNVVVWRRKAGAENKRETVEHATTLLTTPATPAARRVGDSRRAAGADEAVATDTHHERRPDTQAGLCP